jgi:secreted trypsin-like serine protease
MRTPWNYFPVLAALVASACGISSQSEDPGVAHTPIVNGQVDDGHYPQVGTFVRPNPLVAGGPLLSRCTGTLIAKNVFLTAGHCLQTVFDAGLQYGDYGVSFDGVYVPGVSKVILGHGYVHPGFSFDTWLNDVAVVVLDEPVAGVKPKKLVRPNLLEKMSAEDLAEEKIITVGYGFDDYYARTGRGTRRVAVQHFLSLCTVDFSTADCVQDGGHPYYNWAALGGPFEDGNGSICNGDSGGPHFLDGRIMSITSLDLTDCGYGGFAWEASQRVDIKPVRQFIMSFLDECSEDLSDTEESSPGRRFGRVP